MSKAFDTLDHAILQYKLIYYGVANYFFYSYLLNRYQYVEFDGSVSSTKVVDTGVSQGSILGPLLFLNYINNVPRVSTLFNKINWLCMPMTPPFFVICQIIQMQTTYLNSELNKISEWLAFSKLSLNTQKTERKIENMLFHTMQRKIEYPILTISNTVIERVMQFNFLAFMLHYTLK